MAGAGKFMVAAGAVIRNRASGKVLLIHRASNLPGGNIWEYPVGRLNQFEPFEEGLRREVAEETGITSIDIDRPISVFEFMRGEHAADNEVRAVVFAVTTDQEDATISEEHNSYKWLPIDEAIELAEHPGVKRDLETYRSLYP
jgi:8-oxo-dGTP diphosphatase